MSKRLMTYIGEVAVPTEPVDSRKTKVYKALESTSLNDERLLNYGAASEWTEKIVKSVWFRNRIPKSHYGNPRQIVVASTFERYPNSYSSSYSACIYIPYGGPSKLSILHELAHILAPPDIANAKHGRRWANMLLQLVRRYMGEDAWRELRTSFIENRVKYSLSTTKLANVFLRSGDSVEYRLDAGVDLRKMVRILGDDGVVKITIRD